MCEPTTVLLVASLALSAAGGVAQVQGQKANATAQEITQGNLTRANNATAALQLSQLRIQQAQGRESAAREGEKARLASQRSKATATVAAGEAGVQGASVEALMQEYSMNLGQFREASLRQQQLSNAAATDQAENILLGAKYSNLNINAPIAQPQYAAAAINFGADALGAYRAYNPSAFQKKPKTG